MRRSEKEKQYHTIRIRSEFALHRAYDMNRSIQVKFQVMETKNSQLTGGVGGGVPSTGGGVGGGVG